MNTFEAMCIANIEAIDWMESQPGSPSDFVEEIDPFMAIVLRLEDDGRWNLFFSFDIEKDRDEESISYLSWPHIYGARTRADVIDLLKAEAWQHILKSMSIEHDANGGV